MPPSPPKSALGYRLPIPLLSYIRSTLSTRSPLSPPSHPSTILPCCESTTKENIVTITQRYSVEPHSACTDCCLPPSCACHCWSPREAIDAWKSNLKGFSGRLYRERASLELDEKITVIWWISNANLYPDHIRPNDRRLIEESKDDIPLRQGPLQKNC